MNRRSAFICLLTAVKTAVLTSLAMAAEEAAKTAPSIARSHWNINGDWNPSIDEVRDHLRQNHGVDPTGMSLEQMLNVHDGIHNRLSQRHSQKERSKGIPTKGYASF